MTHYVCTGGCGSVSNEPKTCDAKSCMKFGKPMTVCHCADGHHEEAFQNPNVNSEK